MKYWLVKSEPETYSFEDLTKKGEDVWDGIRNFQARNYLREMEIGDHILFYHSGKKKEIVGVAKVSASAFPDPGDSQNKGWLAVKIKPVKALSKPMGLEEIKADDNLRDLPMLKQSRLSVMPVEKPQFDHIIKISS
ncbi:EVE domain-containing protein [Rhodonellum sp.]|uniref:EVE domain-containing protein n=1 Tax=Rhodonellum sp. TaxID=2231180 RepID=UPI00271D3E23|nr:EVE domain-containing protein [Rhodonellum sp.]MDO9552120.1 EVE domain-containing protein [Rhodonellum sp.]